VLALLAALTLSLHPAPAALRASGPVLGEFYEWQPNLQFWKPGPFWNVGSNEEADTNASLHALWSVAVPLVGKHLGGKKGELIAGLSWIGLSLVNEAFFHAPQHPDAAYYSEMRADLITRLVPCLAILVVDLVKGD
jgi:hypothetical protein